MRHDSPQQAAGREHVFAGRLAAAAPAVFAALLGLFILYGVGFAHIPAVHNAAHDARHAFAFPCH